MIEVRDLPRIYQIGRQRGRGLMFGGPNERVSSDKKKVSKCSNG